MKTTIITAFISFISTNIDDIFVLTLFFSQVNDTIKRRHIVIGQYLGIATLTAISILGAQGVSIISHEYVRLLGLVPIYFGIKVYLDYKKENKEEDNLVCSEDIESIERNKVQDLTEAKDNNKLKYIKKLINPSVIKVFSVTVANGGDNIGIYIPVFLRMSLVDIFVTILVFSFLVGLWCFIAEKLAKHGYVQAVIKKYKNILVPIIFIALGIFILSE